jgi:hypothetical protein
MKHVEAAADREARATLALLLKSGRGLSARATFYVTVASIEKAIKPAFQGALDNDPGLLEILDFMGAICEQHARPDGWAPGEGPPAFEALRREWAREHTALRARLYAAAGQSKIADQIAADATSFHEVCYVAAATFAHSCVLKN